MLIYSSGLGQFILRVEIPASYLWRTRMILPNELPVEPKMLSKKALGVTTKTLAHGTMKAQYILGQ